MSEAGYVSLWTPGLRSRQIAKTALVSTLILLTVLGSIGTVIPGIVQALAPFSLSTMTQNSGCPTSSSNSTTPSTNCSTTNAGSNNPQTVGADAVQNPTLPRTVISSAASLIGAGG